MNFCGTIHDLNYPWVLFHLVSGTCGEDSLDCTRDGSTGGGGVSRFKSLETLSAGPFIGDRGSIPGLLSSSSRRQCELMVASSIAGSMSA